MPHPSNTIQELEVAFELLAAVFSASFFQAFVEILLAFSLAFFLEDGE